MMPEMRLGSLRKHFQRDRKADNTCPNCGWTSQQFADTSLVGCPLCYEALDVSLTA
jgi:protein-arginine kinase activator protein McsA